MTKALYRKYRPKSLAEVVGQEQVTTPLISSLKQDKISHAYLFIGPRGTGKTSVARILAHEVNNFSYGVEDDYVDIIEIDGASNRGVDNIRELREKVTIAPTRGKYKIYIIDEVHMLTKEAFNALLKTLEEPPAHVIFIMATTDAYKVPVTITSRAQTYTFKLANPEVMLGFLKSITEKEKIKITDDALKIVVKRGGGSFRDSLSLLDQISTLSDTQITEEMVISALGLPQDEKIHALLDAYLSGDVVKITTIVKELLSSGIKADTLASEIISTIIEKPNSELFSLLAKLPEVKAPFAEAKLLVALSDALCTTKPQRTAEIQQQPKAQQAPDIQQQPKAQQTPDVQQPSGFGQKSEAQQAKSIEQTPKAEVLQPSESDIKPTVLSASANKQSTTVFDWDNFLSRVRELNDAVYLQLLKTNHTLIDDCLNIYPEKKVVKTILSRDNNKRILIDASGGGVKITIHEVGDLPDTITKDSVLTKISDIMGGEVKNDGGENPFGE